MNPINVFLMQPFSTDHASKLKTAIIEELEQMKCLVKRADQAPSPAGFRLQDRIDDFIKKADLCIADLTTPRNHNVLLEVGAALALQIPVIIISNEDLPSNIIGNIFIKMNPEEIFKESNLVNFKKELHQRVLEAKNLIGRTSSDNFIAHGYPNREGVDFGLLISRAERRIIILTTNLAYVVDHEMKSENHLNGKTFLESLMEELPKKNNSGFETKILALDPDSNFTNERARILDRDRRVFREGMRNDLDTLSNELSKIKNVKANVKIYNEYPSQMTFFFDDIIVNSAVARTKSSRFCVTYVHSISNSYARDTFESHFLQLWGSAELYHPQNFT